MEFFQVVSRIMTAVHLGRASLQAYFMDPDGFNPSTHQANGVKKSIEACYRLLF
jgi:hypothetical protein